ncbi:MAG: NUMOD4 domain-containing protein [Planctomycetota bacterium]
MARREIEAWKPIPGFAGYEASTDGRVRSVDRRVIEQRREGMRTKTLKGRVLSIAPRGDGIPRVHIFQRLQSLPRLILLAFHGEVAQAKPGFHDGDPTNCRLDNLFWRAPEDIVGETWLPIPDRANYEASDAGRIRVRDRVVECRLGDGQVYESHRPGHILSLRTQPSGVVVTGIGGSEVPVARLVLAAFVGPPPSSRAVALHRDGKPANNRPSNLEWQERLLTAGEVREIRKRFSRGVRHPRHRISQADLARVYGVPTAVVTQVVNLATYRDVETEADQDLQQRHRTGADNRGSKHGQARLTEADVILMRRLHASGLSADDLAGRFPVTARTIRKILARKAWRHV